jgi:hypothetical protein
MLFENLIQTLVDPVAIELYALNRFYHAQFLSQVRNGA